MEGTAPAPAQYDRSLANQGAVRSWDGVSLDAWPALKKIAEEKLGETEESRRAVRNGAVRFGGRSTLSLLAAANNLFMLNISSVSS